jgi:hypothetical protein
MGFIRIQKRKETWLDLVRRRFKALIRFDVKGRQEKENSMINPESAHIEGAQDQQRWITSRERSGREPQPSTAEIALWQLLFRNW